MIRLDELATYCDTIARTVAQELRPELQTSHARKSADYVLEVLTRLLGQARAGQQIAAAHGRRWSRLCSDMGMASEAAPAVDANVFATFERDLDRLQQRWSAAADSRQLDSPWFSEAVAASEALLEAIEASCLPTSTASSSAKEDDDPKTLALQLSAYLKGRFRELPDDVVSELKIAPGGNTKRTALLSLQPNPVLPERLVLRQDRPVNLTGTQVTDEFPIIDRLHKLGLRVPTPILLEPDGSRLNGAFMLMEQVDAHPAGTYFAEDRVRLPRFIGPQFARDAAAELARLHRATEVQRTDSDADRAVHRRGIAQAYERWQSLDKPANSLIIDLGFAWLERHDPGADRPRCLIHGDYGVHNMMAKDGRLAAILDWELACEEDPAIDLAEARMMMLPDTIPWEEFVSAYLAAGGDPRACDTQAVNYYCVWNYTVKFGLMMVEGRSVYLKGLRTDSLMASVASHSMDRILLYAARALSLAMGTVCTT